VSYALSVFRVPRAILDRLYGKGDRALLAEAMAAIRADLDDFDAELGAPDLENNDVDLSHAEALAEIFSGRFTEHVNSSRYGWAFECLCGFIGEPLSNDGFSPCKTGWYEQLDEILKAHGVPLRFADLIYDAPIPIPPADDWPCVGHWGTAALAATQPLAQLIDRIDEADVKQALQTALGWLRAAEAEPGSVIVGFHG